MSNTKDLSAFRKEYILSALNESDVPPDPLILFGEWLDEAIEQSLPEPNAMTLATVDVSGKPSARVVLLKEVSDGGFVFFTNYNSAKGIELAANPYATLVFLWLELQRQVRVSGKVEKVAQAVSDAYFAIRPRNSQAGAVVSAQSQIISGRGDLEKQFEKVIRQPGTIKRPSYWGGYRLMPGSLEFWQGRESRLHDRLLYTLKDNSWHIQRLAP